MKTKITVQPRKTRAHYRKRKQKEPLGPDSSEERTVFKSYIPLASGNSTKLLFKNKTKQKKQTNKKTHCFKMANFPVRNASRTLVWAHGARLQSEGVCMTCDLGCILLLEETGLSIYSQQGPGRWEHKQLSRCLSGWASLLCITHFASLVTVRATNDSATRTHLSEDYFASVFHVSCHLLAVAFLLRKIQLFEINLGNWQQHQVTQNPCNLNVIFEKQVTVSWFHRHFF